jgi:hypothetical protein
MPSLSGLLNDQRKLSVRYGENHIQIVYKPSAFNGEWAEHARKQIDDMSAVAYLAAVVAHGLVAWDVTEEDGTPVSITPQVLEQLGMGVVSALNTAINGDLLPNLKTGRS